MSLPVVSGRGYLISDGIEIKYSKSGIAYARVPLSFKNSRKTPDGGWTHDKEILIEGTVFGRLAEHLCDLVTTRQDLNFTGELYVEEYEGKKYVKANILSLWPVREDRQSVSATAGSSSARGDNLPF